jgi:hypothetical protein
MQDIELKRASSGKLVAEVVVMEMPDRSRGPAEKYARAGHPSIEELVAEQGTRFPADPADLLGDFWPEDESIEDFLTALHEWRGHDKSGSGRVTPLFSIRTSSRFS